MSSTTSSLHSVQIGGCNDHGGPRSADAHIVDICNAPGFYIMTTLLWIRTDEEPSAKPESSPEPLKEKYTDPDLSLLSLHRDRLIAAAEALGWRHIELLDGVNEGLQALRTSIRSHLKDLPGIEPGTCELRKMRVTISKSGFVGVDSTVMKTRSAEEPSPPPFMPKTLDTSEWQGKVCQVYLDSQQTTPSLFTTHKTGHRPHYDAARQRANIVSAAPTDKEVLLYNDVGEIMEASLCTVYFYRNGTWVTPAAICGGVVGVTRRLAIQRNLCTQGLIELSDLQHGEKIWLSNAVRGFFIGQLNIEGTSPVLLSQNASRGPV